MIKKTIKSNIKKCCKSNCNCDKSKTVLGWLVTILYINESMNPIYDTIRLTEVDLESNAGCDEFFQYCKEKYGENHSVIMIHKITKP